ncbi:MAG: MMPL family transporter [Neomegalonema sp.]|nr:MMPL family transporter [Neomegalonema sp.]
MTRPQGARRLAGLAALMAMLLAALLIWPPDLRSDAAAIFSDRGEQFDPLQSPAGRDGLVLITGPRAQAAASARQIAQVLKADPALARVQLAPVAPSREVLDWLFRHRLHLAPRDAADLRPPALEARNHAARSALSSAQGAVLAEYLLRDPTGAFADLIERVQAQLPKVPLAEGVWRSRDDEAALLFISLRDAPFDARATQALVEKVSALAKRDGLRADLIGPRLIAAQVSAHTGAMASLTSGIAGGLLVLWLLIVFRAPLALAVMMLPLVIGLCVGLLSVQALFGQVHVIALGFGGALTGLALDYPLHLAGHGAQRRHARRVILLGAATTALAFLMMLGAGVSVLGQIGVFVATGLIAAALCACLLPPMSSAPRIAPLLRLAEKWRLPRASAFALIALAALLFVLYPPTQPAPKADLPQALARAVTDLPKKLPMPSARYALRIEAADLAQLSQRGAQMRPAIEQAIAAGALERATLIGDIIKMRGARVPARPELALGDFEQALRSAGMAAGYASVQYQAYREALTTPPPRLPDLAALPELAPILARLEQTPEGLREWVPLFGASEDLAAHLGPLPQGVAFLDLAKPVRDGLARLRQGALIWFAVGIIAALGFLGLALRDHHALARIALLGAAGLSLSAALANLISPGLSIYEIVALTLLTGISVDYGLLAASANASPGNRAQVTAARRSILLCASTTLIAFATMACSPVGILQQIGLTVSFGVLMIAALTLAQVRRDQMETGDD